MASDKTPGILCWANDITSYRTAPFCPENTESRQRFAGQQVPVAAPIKQITTLPFERDIPFSATSTAQDTFINHVNPSTGVVGNPHVQAHGREELMYSLPHREAPFCPENTESRQRFAGVQVPVAPPIKQITTLPFERGMPFVATSEANEKFKAWGADDVGGDLPLACHRIVCGEFHVGRALQAVRWQGQGRGGRGGTPAIGLELAGNAFLCMLPAGSVGPMRAAKVFTNTVERQDAMPFTVVAAPALQSDVTALGAHLSPTAARWGQGVRATDCSMLARYKLCGIVGQRKGYIKMEVCFELSADMVLRVSVVDLSKFHVNDDGFVQVQCRAIAAHMEKSASQYRRMTCVCDFDATNEFAGPTKRTSVPDARLLERARTRAQAVMRRQGRSNSMISDAQRSIYNLRAGSIDPMAESESMATACASQGAPYAAAPPSGSLVESGRGGGSSPLKRRLSKAAIAGQMGRDLGRSRFGGLAMGDPKDTADFQYFTYPALPSWTPQHKSAMSRLLTPGLWSRLSSKRTRLGYSLHNAIQTGVETPHLGVGITAGDEESWTVFEDIMFPVIKDWHGWDPRTNDHKSDLDFSKVSFPPGVAAAFGRYVVSTRIRAARNLSGFGLPAGTTAEDRLRVEQLLSNAFAGFQGDLRGTYYKLGGLNDTQKDFLRSNGFLFQKPKETNLLTNAGAARDWPDGRGIFHNDSRSVLCWVNEEDHCRIISMSTDGDVKGVFARFCRLSNALRDVATSQGTKFMMSKKLGFLGTCPSNLGTGLRASVMIRLPELNKNVPLLEKVCEAWDLQPRGSAGEHSAAVGGKWDISNKQRIGFTEVELVQKMIDGVTRIVGIEEMLANGERVTERDYARSNL